MNYEIEEEDLEQPLNMPKNLGSINNYIFDDEPQNQQHFLSSEKGIENGAWNMPQQIENLVLKRTKSHNSLNQPPLTIKTYNIVIFFAMSYFVFNFMLLIIANIVFFSSNNFTTLLDQNSPDNEESPPASCYNDAAYQ